jgi:hypothetical protein
MDNCVKIWSPCGSEKKVDGDESLQNEADGDEVETGGDKEEKNFRKQLQEVC